MNEGGDLPGQSQLDFDARAVVGEVDLVDGVALAESARKKAGKAAADGRLDLLLRDSLLVRVKEVPVLDAAESASRVPT